MLVKINAKNFALPIAITNLFVTFEVLKAMRLETKRTKKMIKYEKMADLIEAVKKCDDHIYPGYDTSCVATYGKIVADLEALFQPLVGSEKQIKWATEIRLRLAKRFAHQFIMNKVTDATHMTPLRIAGMDYKKAFAAAKAFAGTSSAKTLIENRDFSFA